jgi:hypothetical protein
MMAKDLPNPAEPFDVPRFFTSTNAIKTHFETNGVPTELKQTQSKSETYCFVLACPYSGVDSIDLYCFVRSGEGWAMFLKAYLWKTRPGTVELKPNGNFVDVLRDDEVILKINPPK